MLVTIIILAVTHVAVGVAGFVYGLKRGKQVVADAKNVVTKTVTDVTAKVGKV